MDRFLKMYIRFSEQVDKYGVDIVRIAIAIVFIWFGGVKMIGISPAEELVEKTIFFFPSNIFVPFLGFWEVAIGLGMLIRRFIPYTLFIILPHMAGTFLPLILFPRVCFNYFPFAPSMEGQYILKNLVIIAGALSVTARYTVKQFGEKKSVLL